MIIDRIALGAGAAILALVLTFMMPVQARRVNQTLITVMIAVLFFLAAYALLDFPLWLGVAIGATLLSILYRDVMRWVKHTVYGVTKYRRRDYWYRKVGQAVVGKGRRTKRNE